MLFIDYNQWLLFLTAGNKEEAVGWYRKGVMVLEKGIKVTTIGASPQDKENIVRIQAKMMKNLEMAKERIKDLGKVGKQDLSTLFLNENNFYK